MFYDKTFGYTIFCDDIRSEIDGKISFIGMYLGAISINAAMPAVIPKFAFGIRYFEEPGFFKEDVLVRIYQTHEDESARTSSLFFNTPRSYIERAESPETNVRSGSSPKFGHVGFFSPIVVAPFVITKPGKIKVRAYCGDVVTKIGSISVVTPYQLEIGAAHPPHVGAEN